MLLEDVAMICYALIPNLLGLIGQWWFPHHCCADSVTGNTAAGKESLQLHQSNRKLKDQLFEARAYYPSIAKLKEQESLTLEVKLHIQDHEHMLSDAVSDYDLQPFVQVKIHKMDEAIAKAKAHTVDCYNINRKLRQILDLIEDEAHFHMKQSAFLYQLGVQTMSKSFHCLSMRLTVEYFKSPSADTEHSISNKIDDPRFQQCDIFKKHIGPDSGNMIFHVLTNKQNFYSMKQWFARNSYGKATTIHVLNFNELKLKEFNNLDLEEMSMSEEFRVSTHAVVQPSPLQTKIKYISKDISFLWNLDLGGKVNGAVEYCGIKLSELKSYLDTDRYDGNSCAWMSGINVLNLEKWREHDITGKYQRFLRQLQLHHENEASWRAAAIQASLLVFHDQIYALDDILFEQGLDHDYQVCKSNVKNAAVLHFDGNMKPWLDLGIPKYKKRGLWKNAMLIYKSKCRIKLKQSPSNFLVSNFKKLPILNFKALRTAFEESPTDLEWEVSDGSWFMRLII
ncbi:hypothetical protein ZIOFF_056352 [Zingiber officinale]|uniref:Hexosyltransferase n=1 Tax=Zingiber officinale TaxID=94328 RepID=A0A8J5FXZ5_ZINOF|nr:hypothetical protein ZIOFF_056352 [Zingiber officinale]